MYIPQPDVQTPVPDVLMSKLQKEANIKKLVCVQLQHLHILGLFLKHVVVACNSHVFFHTHRL